MGSNIRDIQPGLRTSQTTNDQQAELRRCHLHQMTWTASWHEVLWTAQSSLVETFFTSMLPDSLDPLQFYRDPRCQICELLLLISYSSAFSTIMSFKLTVKLRDIGLRSNSIIEFAEVGRMEDQDNSRKSYKLWIPGCALTCPTDPLSSSFNSSV